MVLLLSLLFACVESWSPLDLDADGVTPDQGDCDDLNAEVFPTALETWYDGVDQDCDGDDVDQDGDGHGASAAGGDDCDDVDAAAHPGAAEDGTD